MAFVEPLNLRVNLIQHFAGSEAVFIMLAVLFTLYFAAKNRMSLGAALPMVAFVVIIIGSSTLGGSFQPLVQLILLLAAIAISFVMAKVGN